MLEKKCRLRRRCTKYRMRCRSECQCNIVFSTFSVFSYFRNLQLPSRISDSEISKVAGLFSPNSLETVAVQYFRVTEAQISNSKVDNVGNSDAFKRGLLQRFKNKGGNRKVILFRDKDVVKVQLIRG